MFLKVSPIKGVVRLGVRGKINHWYISPYQILERIGLVDYRLALLLSLAGVHDLFHVSLLRKCLSAEDAVINTHQLEVQPESELSREICEDSGQRRETVEDEDNQICQSLVEWPG